MSWSKRAKARPVSAIRVAKVAVSPNFLAFFVVLCFERQCSEPLGVQLQYAGSSVIFGSRDAAEP